jgi:7,8-dihydropterin-6-yl-methyl-4-(beta-D-ribofuranosyl)aminobenzene 5'-phosphate synthase
MTYDVEYDFPGGSERTRASMNSSDLLSRLSITVLAEDSVQYESPLLGQHGISFLLEARRQDQCRRVLVDVGQNSSALLHNMSLLGIQPSAIDALFLTHCHYDHTQGTVEVLKAVGKKALPVVVHPDTFRPHFIKDPYLRHVGMMPEDSPTKIEAAGGLLFLTRDPFSFLPGLITTGEVPRHTDFEEVGLALFTLAEGRMVQDKMMDDISLVAHMRDKGLVIVTGCSHSGIVNIVKHSVELTGEKRIAAIVGGFHLLAASKERILKTTEALSQHDVLLIAAGHCTGFKAQAALYRAFEDRFKPLQTGMIFDF